MTTGIEPLAPLYAEHPRHVGTFWEHVGWGNLSRPVNTGPRMVDPCGWLQGTRIACGQSQAELGRRCGVSQSMVGYWEHGILPVNARHIRPLAAALGMEPAALIARLKPDGTAE